MGRGGHGRDKEKKGREEAKIESGVCDEGGMKRRGGRVAGQIERGGHGRKEG